MTSQIKRPSYTELSTTPAEEQEANLTKKEDFLEHKKMQSEVKQIKKDEERSVLKLIIGSQIGIAFISAIVIAVLFFVTNCPLTQTHNYDSFTKENQSWWALLLVFVISFLVIFFVPFGLKLLSRRK